MVMAKIHIICGNCGSNDMFAAQIDNKGRDVNAELVPEVFLQCGNCATIHALSEQMPLAVYDPKKEKAYQEKIKNFTL